jgi:hypothetical protein
MKTLPILIVALALAACNTPNRQAAVGGISADLDRAFRGLDANADGFVSRDEAQRDPAVMRAFDQADRDRDGRLDESEFKSAPPTGYRQTSD